MSSVFALKLFTVTKYKQPTKRNRRMGREIRMVPKGWKHPKKYNGNFQPMFDSTVDDDYAEWIEEFEKFKSGELAEVAEKYNYNLKAPYAAFCSWWGCPPDPEYRRPFWKEEDITHYQMYETVSEGTPVSPVFENKDQLIDYLVENGDYWDQSRRKQASCSMNCDPWSREQAENFVKAEWKPSMIFTVES